MRARSQREIVLALYPLSRAMAYMAFEGPLSPHDWGIKKLRGSRQNARALDAAGNLIERLQPAALVLASAADPRYRRGSRVRRLERLIANHARGRAVEVHSFTRAQIRECFEGTGASTRYEIAQVIASQIHALNHRLPPPRKPWKSEDHRMGLFHAAALVLTFYCQTGPIAGQPAE